MKSTIFSWGLRLSSLVMFMVVLPFYANACGPYGPIIPTPKFFTSNWEGLLNRDFDKQENLRLWQELTSSKIPLEDIEQAVYEDDKETVDDILTDAIYRGGKVKTNNLFYVYLQNARDAELLYFLYVAKDLEERRKEKTSPWYYPSSRNTNSEAGDFQDIIDECSRYKGNRIQDRYALQAVRALFASRQYEDCVEYFNKSFQGFPDSNLFKRMAMGYVAGCWSRLGNIDKANEYFALSGDFYSIKTDNPVAYMAEYNPDDPALMSYIQSCSDDSAKFCAIRPIAENLLRRKKVRHRGDWEFLLAYIEGEYRSDYRSASQYISKAIRHEFSSDDLRDHARAYRMKIDAENGNHSSLLTDLRWLESKVDLLSRHANEWNRIMQNIIYVNWIPKLWEKKDYTTAILLCGYADNMLGSKQNIWRFDVDEQYNWRICAWSLDEMRKSKQYKNTQDYSSLSFQLMGALSSGKLIDVKRNIASENALFAHLRKYARTDSDYFNELIGTLALREGNYQRAVRYFATVSDEYLQTMNIYKEGYLNRDPFAFYPSSWHENSYGECEPRAIKEPLQDSIRIKYNFAKRMLALQNRIKSGKTADERGMAQLIYAIGRYSSFDNCWALTHYWCGEYVGLFRPMLQYWDDNFDKYDKILYDYKNTFGYHNAEEIYQSDVEQAMMMFQSDEAKAKAEYILGNLRTVVKRYGNTATAQFIKTSCDNWHSWL